MGIQTELNCCEVCGNIMLNKDGSVKQSGTICSKKCGEKWWKENVTDVWYLPKPKTTQYHIFENINK